MMDIERHDHKRSAILRVSGRIDSSTAPKFEEALMDAVDDKHNVVVNLRNVEYLSSAAIRALIGALKETRSRHIHKGNLVLVETPAKIHEVFDLAALTSLFEFYEDETTAVGSF